MQRFGAENGGGQTPKVYTPAPKKAVDIRGFVKGRRELAELVKDAERVDFEADVEERIVEIPKKIETIVEREVVVPEVFVVEVEREIPQIQEVIRQVPKYSFEERIRYRPIVTVQYLRREVEVPQVLVRQRTVEVPQVQRILRQIPRIQVKEIPVPRRRVG